MNDLMTKAVELMVAGMGFVFVFLIILVFATTLMSKVVARFAPPEPAIPARTSRARSSVPPSVDADTAEAIKLAITKFRARHKK